jgi:peptide/nickel transport system ATP-binding protein/oligopeptide transport system ATP-binding protein
LLAPPEGCRFRPRCPHAFGKCTELPELEQRLPTEKGHLDRCWLDPSEKKEKREVAGRIGLEVPSEVTA